MVYDLIIAGGGLSGLSLLYQLSKNEQYFSTKKILLIDRVVKTENDRTWCFWQCGVGDFDAILRHQWQEVLFKSKTFERVFSLTPYRYKMLQSADFYLFMQNIIDKNENITQVFEEILNVETRKNQAVVTTKNNVFFGKNCANSIPIYAADTAIKNEVPSFIPPPKNKKNEKNVDLLQHFKGFIIQTRLPKFDKNRATLMDFSIPQEGDCRFVYVLPTDEKTALVEYTVFSDALLSQEKYDECIYDYIANRLDISEFDIMHEEFGVIPMSLKKFPPRLGDQVICIGTAGGNTRSSTGYTFMNIQKETTMLAQYLTAEKPLSRYQSPLRNAKVALQDRVLFEVITNKKLTIEQIFTTMFAKNSVQQIFKFLDGETSIFEDLPIMSGMNMREFIPAAFRSLHK